MRKTGDKQIPAEMADETPETRTEPKEMADETPETRTEPKEKKTAAREKQTGKTAAREKQAGKTAAREKQAGKNASQPKKRSKAKRPNEKLSPASIYKKMIAFGKTYQVEKEQDFLEAARIYAEEAGLIDQMRDKLAEDGLTIMKTYKTGEQEVAHPLLSELPRHVESANKCLTTISGMIADRGAKKERAARDLDAFRLH